MATVDIQAGQLVADCRLVRLLGSGGEGQVWEATRLDGSPCAMKLVLPEVLPSAEEVRDRGRWLVRINHPAMVTVTRGGRFTGGDLKDWGFVEMELVSGTSLQHAPPDPQALEHLAGVGEALDLLHEGTWSDGVPLVHRDVKPGNLIATDRGLVLVDPSTLRGVDTRDLTRVGTPAYVAPEVASGVFGTNVDVYSFAATAAALLTGLRGTQLRKLVDAPINSGLPAGVVAGLHINPNKRPETCAEVVSGKILPRRARPVPEGSTIIGRGTLVPPERPGAATTVAQRSAVRPRSGGAEPSRTQMRQPPMPVRQERSSLYDVQHRGDRQGRIPARRPIEVAASSGSDWEGASRVSPLGYEYRAPLRAWPVLALFVVLMALAVGWYGMADPEIGITGEQFVTILGGVGIGHVALHLFNRRPLLGLLLPTYAWGAALGDTSGTHRHGWVTDVASGWLTVWAAFTAIAAYTKTADPLGGGFVGWVNNWLPGPIAKLVNNDFVAFLGTASIPDWFWVIFAVGVWIGVLVIRSMGRAIGPIHFIAALINLPFQFIGGLPRWIFRW
ncbi:serine/threonine protein kinase [Stomatohabitans albus]|uniref:serine/threonine protein kinase n=1 Tax=Stomatohabitans albus TaxID=3110766 RepID=UPI00300C788A